MYHAILWVLIVVGPRPYPVEEFPTHAACVQAKYDYGRIPGNGHLQPERMKCVQRYQ